MRSASPAALRCAKATWCTGKSRPSVLQKAHPQVDCRSYTCPYITTPMCTGRYLSLSCRFRQEPGRGWRWSGGLHASNAPGQGLACTTRVGQAAPIGYEGGRGLERKASPLLRMHGAVWMRFGSVEHLAAASLPCRLLIVLPASESWRGRACGR